MKGQRFATIKQYQDFVDAEAKKQLAEYTEEKVQHAIKQRLESHIDRIVSSSIGFDDRWGNWEVDSRNGREPAIVAMIKKELEPMVRSIIDGYEFKPTASMINSVKSEYRERWYHAIRKASYRTIESDVVKYV